MRFFDNVCNGQNVDEVGISCRVCVRAAPDMVEDRTQGLRAGQDYGESNPKLI